MMDEYVCSSRSGNYRRAHAACKGIVCACCGAKENLQVHHIDNDIANNEPDNLERLCVTCHAARHNSLKNWIKGNPAHKGRCERE